MQDRTISCANGDRLESPSGWFEPIRYVPSGENAHDASRRDDARAFSVPTGVELVASDAEFEARYSNDVSDADAQVFGAVLAELVRSDDAALDLNVTVSHGEVTLRGCVPSAELKLCIPARCRAVDGVVCVNDQLCVRED